MDSAAGNVKTNSYILIEMFTMQFDALMVFSGHSP